jgi:N utilization substance protein A
MSFLLKEIKETPRGKKLILSRSDARFVQKLFEREVPEMSSGSVEVKAIAREAGVRTKMAVFSNQSGVDPVGSCVGQKGVRVQAVTNELGGERVDIIPWNEKLEEFIKGALAPAEGLLVSLNEDEETAEIKAPEDQLSLAIGKDGQNARLAAKLTGWRIEVKSMEGEEVDSLGKQTAEEETEEEEDTENEKKKGMKGKVDEESAEEEGTESVESSEQEEADVKKDEEVEESEKQSEGTKEPEKTEENSSSVKESEEDEAEESESVKKEEAEDNKDEEDKNAKEEKKSEDAEKKESGSEGDSTS